ncbi:SpoIID/LytB domain-containing protein, partial [Kitasatospora phosalacinea]|uniref:SpoIID/LytB domain-containing protein n=1 Tax=Kitasatospora phosalacinea TaxID=2065 RepID=UPI00364CDF80
MTDTRGAQVSGGVISLPTAAPRVAGARIEVDGHLVARTDSAGGFTFDYPAPTGRAVTVTVIAPGFGDYQLSGVTPANTGDSLAVHLTDKAQSMTDQAAPVPVPQARAMTTLTAVSGNCGGYSSDSTPPSNIRVLEYAQHTSVGAPVAGTEIGVVNVPFRSYVESVLPSEWVPSWQPASLAAGAMAAKTYAWYWVNHWRGGSYGGTCYNVDDSINYQRYIPGQSNASTNAAVAATWNSAMTKNGSIFEASFQATLTGNQGESCGSGLANYPNTLSQWGSQNCALAGRSWQSILGVYYPGVSIGGASSAGGFGTVSLDGSGTHAAFVDAYGSVANDWVSNGAWQG